MHPVWSTNALLPICGSEGHFSFIRNRAVPDAMSYQIWRCHCRQEGRRNPKIPANGPRAREICRGLQVAGTPPYTALSTDSVLRSFIRRVRGYLLVCQLALAGAVFRSCCTSRIGGMPKRLLYSRLKEDASRYPTRKAALAASKSSPSINRRASSSRRRF